jgi:hypothetical protein
MEIYDSWPMPPNTKWCTRCKRAVSLTNFNRNKTRCDGFQSECKPCRVVLSRGSYRRLLPHTRAKVDARNKANRNEYIKNLADPYVKSVMRNQGISPDPFLIEAKRLQLQLHRMTHGQTR